MKKELFVFILCFFGINTYSQITIVDLNEIAIRVPHVEITDSTIFRIDSINGIFSFFEKMRNDEYSITKNEIVLFPLDRKVNNYRCFTKVYEVNQKIEVYMLRDYHYLEDSLNSDLTEFGPNKSTCSFLIMKDSNLFYLCGDNLCESSSNFGLQGNVLLFMINSASEIDFLFCNLNHYIEKKREYIVDCFYGNMDEDNFYINKKSEIEFGQNLTFDEKYSKILYSNRLKKMKLDKGMIEVFIQLKEYSIKSAYDK